MENLDVRIINLPPFRAARFTGFGQSPELEAQEKMLAWARSRNLLAAGRLPRIFGFNNPSPTPGSPNYGYELWLEVRPEENDAAASFVEVPGCRYAALRCTGVDNIYPAWQNLVAWCEQSPHRMGAGQCLEEHLRFIDLPVQNYEMDLLLPLKD